MGVEPARRNVRSRTCLIGSSAWYCGLVAALEKIEWNAANPTARRLREHADNHQDNTEHEHSLLRALAREHFAQFKSDEQKAGQFEQMPEYQ